jgi:putative hydrolase of the HAD superfamily
MAPRAILLDALGTLLELEPPAPRLRLALREQHGVEVSLEQAAAALRIEMGHYRSHCIAASDAAALARLRLDCAAILARELDLGDVAPEELLPALLGSLRFVPYPDVAPALQRRRADGAALVVASNWDISLHDVLRESGLRELLDGVATSAEVGAAKPAGELFAAALALAGVSAAEAIHVGDSLLEDVDGARAAGIEAVWLRRGGGEGRPPEGVRVIATLAEL